MSPRTTAVTRSGTTIHSARRRWSARTPPHEGSGHESKRDDYSLELPLGWVRRTADVNDYFVTRHGPALNYIVVTRQPHDRKLPRTQRETRADMLPHELAELCHRRMENTAATANLELLASTPIMLGSSPPPACRSPYRNERGLPSERVLVCLVDSRGRLSLMCRRSFSRADWRILNHC